jgi:hypothetical protein
LVPSVCFLFSFIFGVVLFRAPLEAAPAGEGLFVRPAVAFGLTGGASRFLVGTRIDLITDLFDFAGMGAGVAGESLSVFAVGPLSRDGRVAGGTEVGTCFTGVATGTAFKGAATFFSLVGDVFCLTGLATGFSSFFLGSGINGAFAFGGGFVGVLLVFFIFDP